MSKLPSSAEDVNPETPHGINAIDWDNPGAGNDNPPQRIIMSENKPWYLHPLFVRDEIELREKRPITKGWTNYEGTERDVRAFLARGSNLGLLGRNWCVIDGDITKPGLAKIGRDLALEIWPGSPERTRGSSKFLLMTRNPGGLRKQRFVFRDEQGDEHAVERLATGQQFLIHGMGAV
jgi:hypothetical protein